MDESQVSQYILKRISDYEDVDISLISTEPWAQDMWKKIQETVQKGFLNWCKIVLNVGDTENLSKWTTAYLENVESFTCDLIDDISGLESKLIVKIEELLQRLQEICRDLHTEMPVLGHQRLSLADEQIQLKKTIKEYEKIMEVRKKELDLLRSKQLELCESLGTEPKIIKDRPLPTSEELDEFQRHIEKLESEKFERLETFFKIKSEIVEIIDELKIKPCSQFEEDVLSSDNFQVTKQNMNQLNSFHSSLKKQQVSVVEELQHLKTRIDELWNILDVDMMEREEIKQRLSGNSIENLEGWRSEVKKCEEIKKANIKMFIDKLREELVSLWDKCHYSNGSKTFKYFTSDCYTEDLLELHSREITKWKNYYEENKELLSLLVKHNELWRKVLEFEEKKAGPDRYKNRGGQLLREEKERNKLSKLIPKLEDEIRELADSHEQRYGTPFMTFDQTIEEYIGNLHDDLENNRKLKLSARKQQREQALTPAKSMVSLFPSTTNLATPTPLSATKRKITATPRTDSKKLRGGTAVTTPRSALDKNKMPTIKVTRTSTSMRHKRLSSEKKRHIKKVLRRSGNFISKSNSENINDNTVSSEYMDFQSELSSRRDCRSTILPDNIRTPGASTSKARTPIKPSMKPKTLIKCKSPGRVKTTPRHLNNNKTALSIHQRSPVKLLF